MSTDPGISHGVGSKLSWLGPSVRRNAFLLAGVLLVVGVAVVFAGRELEHHLGALEAWVAHLGWPGMAVFVLIVAVGLCLLLPETPFSVAAGLLFGLWGGIAIIFLANVLAGALQYALGYRLLREPIRRRLGSSKVAGVIDRATSSKNAKLQLLLRLMPIHQAVASYLLGAARTSFPRFLLAFVGMLPILTFEVYVGLTGKHLALMAVGILHGSWQHNALLIAGFVVMLVVVGFVARWAYKAVLRVMAM